MRMNFFSVRLRMGGMLAAAGFLAGLGSLLGFLGPWAWWLDLAAHFRVQYALFFLALAGITVLLRRWRWAAWCALFLVINGLPIVLFLLPSAAPVPAPDKPIRAMLANVNTARGDPGRVLQAILAENPDILVLEEINYEWLEALAPALAVYSVQVFEPRLDNFGIGFWSRLPCAATQVVYLGKADVPSITAEVSLGGRPVQVIASHPLPPGSAAYAAFRNEQLARLAEWCAGQAGPVLLLGDLNVSPWSYYYRRLLAESGLRDSARGRSLRPTWPSMSKILGIQIDHCLHSPEIAIVGRRVGANTGSDHYPLMVDFVLKD